MKDETPFTTEEAKRLLTEVHLPLLGSHILRTILIHAVGKKLFPEVFTGFGRSVAVSWLIGSLTTPIKPTPRMRRIMKDIERSAEARRVKP